jgi:hypothetical protein
MEGLASALRAGVMPAGGGAEGDGALVVTVLAVPGCANGPLLDERLTVAAPGVRVVRRVVGDEGEAAALGMRGSPTLLVDGVDPFATGHEPFSVSCRLYRQGDGSVAGAPPVEALRRVLAGGGAGEAGDG